MKQKILKIFSWLYIISVFLFYEEIFMPFSFLHSKYIIDGFSEVILLCFLPVILFLVLLVLDFKRFFKLKYFLLVIGPLLFTCPVIGEVQEHGWIYLTPNFH